jgi:hypothetical protein
MGATELQSNWPEMRKTLEKPGFHSGEGGIPIGTLSKSLKINWFVATSLITARYLRINQIFAMFGSD